MSTDKKLPPVEPAPFQRFTVRLVDGHFVRVPKLEHISVTNATRPPTAMPPGAVLRAKAAGDHVTPLPRTMRLVNGKFVRLTELAEDRSSGAANDKPPVISPGATGLIARPVAPAGARPPAETPAASQPWAVTFGTRLESPDLRVKS